MQFLRRTLRIERLKRERVLRTLFFATSRYIFPTSLVTLYSAPVRGATARLGSLYFCDDNNGGCATAPILDREYTRDAQDVDVSVYS